jgi:hypothetical protein
MRLIGALLSAALIASAVVTILEMTPSPLALIGLALALTPMALFTAASINPNGLEIAAAIGIWVHGAAIATGRLPMVGKRLVTRLGIASVVLALNRPTSLLWLGVIGVLLMICAGRQTVNDLLHHTAARLWAAALSIAIVLQLGWSLGAGAFKASQTFVGRPVSATTSEFLRTTVGQSYDLLRQMVGNFGWLDTPAPAVTLLLWLFGLGAVVGITILVAPRLLRTIAATVILVVVVPVAIQASYVHTIGFQWQGRYSLPLAVGVPILAGFGLGLAGHRVPRSRRLVILIVAGLAVAQFFAFAQALRRYTVGSNGTVWFPRSAHWGPPVPSLVLLFGVLGLLSVTSVLLVRVGAEFTAPTVSTDTPEVPMAEHLEIEDRDGDRSLPTLPVQQLDSHEGRE